MMIHRRLLLALVAATAWTDAMVFVTNLSPNDGEKVASSDGSIVLSANVRDTSPLAKIVGAQFNLQENGVGVLEQTVFTATSPASPNAYALQIDGLGPGKQYCFRVKGVGQFTTTDYSQFSCFSIPGSPVLPPDEVTPDEVTPDEVTPDEVTPDEVTPDEVTPDEGPPDEGPPDEGPPDEGPPDEGPPDEGPPDLPNTQAPLPNIQYGLQEDCFRREPGIFSICLDLSSDSGTIEPWMTSFLAARERWERVITANGVDFPTFSVSLDTRFTATGAYPEYIDGVYIASSVEFIDGPGQFGRGNILGSAAPIYVARTRNGVLPVTGFMRFDSFDMQRLVDAGTIDGVIEHEMGHVLGIGSLWEANGLYSGQIRAADNLYKGANVVREWTLQGCELVGGFAPIVELDGGPGTRGGHFDERCFGDELMTGSVDIGMKLSKFTIASLQDIGYAVDYSQAANFTVPPQCCSPGAARRLNDPRKKRRRYHRKLSVESEEMIVEYGLKELEKVKALRLALDENLDTIDIADVITVYVENDGHIVDVEVAADGTIFL